MSADYSAFHASEIDGEIADGWYLAAIDSHDGSPMNHPAYPIRGPYDSEASANAALASGDYLFAPRLELLVSGFDWND